MLPANPRRTTHQEAQGGLFVALQGSGSRFVRAAQNRFNVIDPNEDTERIWVYATHVERISFNVIDPNEDTERPVVHYLPALFPSFNVIDPNEDTESTASPGALAPRAVST